MKKQTLAIVSYYSQFYVYALKAQARRIVPNLSHLNRDEWDIHYIACTDTSKETKEAFEFFRNTLGDSLTYHHITFEQPPTNNQVPYKEDSQLMIAQMTQAVLDKARSINADYTWMLEGDVLPAPNALRCLLDVVNFDGGYYGVSFSPYSSNGGGSFLGGFGSPSSPIHKDFLPNERKLSEEQKARLDTFNEQERAFQTLKKRPDEQWIKDKIALEQEIEKCPPAGNIWDLNAKTGWRRRGWLDFAYPAISKGMIAPVDWCGTGNNILTRKALEVSFLDGYSGKGTQDLYLIWHRWYPSGIKIGLTTHCLSDHAVRVREEKDGLRTEKIVLLQAYHEQQGESAGHIRWRSAPWYASELGEKFDPLNDGKLRREVININDQLKEEREKVEVVGAPNPSFNVEENKPVEETPLVPLEVVE